MWRLILVLWTGCGRFGFDPLLADAPQDAPIPLGAWSTPVRVVTDPTTPLDDPSLTEDQLELYVNADTDLRVLRRASRDDPWGPLEVPLGAIDNVTQPFVSADGLTMYLSDFSEIVISTRADRAAAWSLPVSVPELNTPLPGGDAAPRPDELELALNVVGEDTLSLVHRADRADPWGSREIISSIIDGGEASFGDLGLALYFASSQDLFRSQRAALTQPFGLPEPISELNSAVEDSDPWVSADGRTIYFTSARGGRREIWMSTR